jgi:RNA polymerase sigma-70 factor (ECF subfamily)
MRRIALNVARQVNYGGTLTDGDLVERIRKGDKPLFEAVMRRYNQRLFRLARSLLRDDSEAEDVLQDAYVRAYAHLDQLHDVTRLGSWLSHIVIHECRGRLRRRGRHMQLCEQAGKGAPVRIVPGPVMDPEEQAVNHQLGGVLARAIDSLSLGYRVVFVLRDVEGLSTAEVAESLGITEMAVKTRLHRARAALREELFSRIGAAALPPFSFDGARCDRIVDGVLSKI